MEHIYREFWGRFWIEPTEGVAQIYENRYGPDFWKGLGQYIEQIAPDKENLRPLRKLYTILHQKDPTQEHRIYECCLKCLFPGQLPKNRERFFQESSFERNAFLLLLSEGEEGNELLRPLLEAGIAKGIFKPFLRTCLTSLLDLPPEERWPTLQLMETRFPQIKDTRPDLIRFFSLLWPLSLAEKEAVMCYFPSLVRIGEIDTFYTYVKLLISMSEKERAVSFENVRELLGGEDISIRMFIVSAHLSGDEWKIFATRIRELFLSKTINFEFILQKDEVTALATLPEEEWKDLRENILSQSALACLPAGERVQFVYRLSKIPVKERKNFLEEMEGLCGGFDTYRLHVVIKLFDAFFAMAPARRQKVWGLLFGRIEDCFVDPLVLTSLEVIGSLPERDFQSIFPLLQRFRRAEITPRLLLLLSSLPPGEREEVFNAGIEIDRHIKAEGREFFDILEILATCTEKDRKWLMLFAEESGIFSDEYCKIKNLYAARLIPEQLRDRFLQKTYAYPYLNPETLLGILLSFGMDQEKSAIHSYLETKLIRIEREGIPFCNAELLLTFLSLPQVQEKLLLRSNDTLTQRISFMRGQLQSVLVDRKKHPILTFKRLEKESEAPLSDYEPPFELVGGREVRFDLAVFQKHISEETEAPLLIRNLPEKVRANSLDPLLASLKEKVKEHPEVLESVFESQLEARFEVLRKILLGNTEGISAIMLAYVQRLPERIKRILLLENQENREREIKVLVHQDLVNQFNEKIHNFETGLMPSWISARERAHDPDEVASAEEGQFFCLVNHLLSQSSTAESGSYLTPQEELLLGDIITMSECATGQTDGLALLYGYLPIEYRLQKSLKKNPLTAPMEDRIKDSVQRALLFKLSEDSSLLRDLAGLKPSEDIPQYSHQVLYLKNLLARTVGLAHTVDFDFYSLLILEALLQKTPQEAVRIFYRHFTPKELVHFLTRESHEGLSMAFQALCEESRIKIDMSLCFSEDYTRLTEFGAVAVLQAMGYLVASESGNE
ncbi:MAG: hypothetical protein A3F09_02405 [Chlamydiae bacterium RIFCSPHIGHO2_12_FULL_49_11]|nr:MAG: hypothetical protein A3F09_02405 [Chlamydiae bacterium RIFCSPHIGHO2_12_FULL_49_11]